MTKTILVTGGAGFIGVHTCDHFAKKGWSVVALDNLSRRGASENLKWLQQNANVRFAKVDIRQAEQVCQVFEQEKPDVIIHLAAQVAVTFSVQDPRHDFETNALGTFNVLEATRLHCPDAFFINASTNKVYGKMETVGVCERNGRYEYEQAGGIAETFPLDFHSPYGCSKGTADQYTIDYSRIYGLRATTFRQSCIYGTRQFGIEDQGWVAWFSIAAALGKPITVFGDGKQIRDVLYVSDLVRAYEAAINRPDAASGQAFNIGGGPANTLSLLELLAHLKQVLGKEIEVAKSDWRPGDQKVFVCNINKAKELLGWSPEISVDDGVQRLIKWAYDNRSMFDF
ncbi:MAG: SDR family NAD(P)-dependent oxidoreductase [Aureliella sp.]